MRGGCAFDRHADTADLLELALAQGSSSARLAWESCPVCGPELARIEAFVGAMRVDSAAPEDPAFTARVLAATTREDLRRVVDLRLCAGFLRESLRKQRMLRFAAAGLLFHVLALSILAFLAFRDGPRKALRAPVAARADGAEARTTDAEDSRGSAHDGDQANACPRDMWEGDNERRSTRLRLASALDDSLRASPEENARHGSLLVRLLHACSERYKAGHLAEFVRSGEQIQDASALEAAIWVELLLDHYALCGEVAPGLQPALDQLARARVHHPADAELCQLLRQRAEVLGFRISGQPPSRPQNSEGQAESVQLGRELAMVWSQALRPLAEKPDAHPSLAAWSAWWGAEALGEGRQTRGQ